MSIFWTIYLITLGSIIVLTGVIALLFDFEHEPVSISYVVLADLLGAIPCANILCGIALIVIVLTAIADGDITPKF